MKDSVFDYDYVIEQRLRDKRFSDKRAVFHSIYSSESFAPKPRPLVTGSMTGRPFRHPGSPRPGPAAFWSFASCPCQACTSARGDEGTQTPLHPSAVRQRVSEQRRATRGTW